MGRVLPELGSPQEAVEMMVGRLGGRVCAVERVRLSEAVGRVLRADVVSDRQSPAVDVSAMDGYAVRLDEMGEGVLPVSGEARVGREPPSMVRGGAVRIVTGAAVPADAEAVVKREDVQEEGERISFSRDLGVKRGQHIRRGGENLAAGEVVCEAERVISASVAASLATFGVTEVAVSARVRVGVISTGDELVAPEETPSPWSLRDSNGPVLEALVGAHRWMERGTVARVGDDEGELRGVIGSALETCDALFVTGGVSMGQWDFIPGVLADLGCELVFHKVAQRPGKPMLGAIARVGERVVPVLALPGNPVSVMVTSHRIGVGVLRSLAGLGHSTPRARVEVRVPDEATLHLWWHRLVRLGEDGRAELVVSKGSGDIPSASRSDGFIEVPPETRSAGTFPFYAWAGAG